ncbi:MAG: divalent metal cation transporter [Planctomycetota bacterium]
MSSDRHATERQVLLDLQKAGAGRRFFGYVKLSGPGWLQSALTLGGGSLSSSLYLGVLAGSSLLWIQPFAMVLGVIMLSAIGYVTLSTSERPFGALNRHVSPVLGWSWALASLAANMVWALPQYSLASGVLQQNLMPGLLGPDGPLGDTGAKVLIVSVILVTTTLVTWSYGRSGPGIRLFERTLKIVVAIIVLCFIGVVVRLATADGLDWGRIARGFIPSFGSLFEPSDEFSPLLGAVDAGYRDFWRTVIVEKQRDVMMAAVATAVGINMTFLFPYSLLRRGWGKEYRGLTVFDLSTGMLIPFVLATSCVVIASASRFHAEPPAGLVDGGADVAASQQKDYQGLLERRLASEWEPPVGTTREDVDRRLEELPRADRVLAATLVKRDAFDLAQSLEPLTGRLFANVIFGLGVLAMTVSTISLLMLISGLVLCEILGKPPEGTLFKVGTLFAATGALGPFLWSKAAFWLAIPTSIFGLTLLPIAYLSFLFLMNRPALLGPEMLRGGKRIASNTVLVFAAGLATVASIWMIWINGNIYGIAAVATLLMGALTLQFIRASSDDL